MGTRREVQARLIAHASSALSARQVVFSNWPNIGWTYRPSVGMEVSISFQPTSGGPTSYGIWIHVRRWDVTLAMRRVLRLESEDAGIIGFAGDFFQVINQLEIDSVVDTRLFPVGVSMDVEARLEWFFSYFNDVVLSWSDTVASLSDWLRFCRGLRRDWAALTETLVTGDWLLRSPMTATGWDRLIESVPAAARASAFFRGSSVTLGEYLDRLRTTVPEDWGLGDISQLSPPPIRTRRPRSGSGASKSDHGGA